MNVLLTLKVSATMTTLQINLSNKVHQARLIILMLMRRLSTLLFVGHMCCVVLVPAVAFCTLVKINFCRPFIFSTAPTIHKIIAIKQAYILLEESEREIADLHENIAFFRQKMQTFPHLKQYLVDSHSPIQGLVVAGNDKVRQAATKMQAAGFDVRPIIAPTVAKGSERIRICLHSFNTKKQITKFFISCTIYIIVKNVVYIVPIFRNSLHSLKMKYQNGLYYYSKNNNKICLLKNIL